MTCIYLVVVNSMTSLLIINSHEQIEKLCVPQTCGQVNVGEIFFGLLEIFFRLIFSKIIPTNFTKPLLGNILFV